MSSDGERNDDQDSSNHEDAASSDVRIIKDVDQQYVDVIDNPDDPNHGSSRRNAASKTNSQRM